MCSQRCFTTSWSYFESVPRMKKTNAGAGLTGRATMQWAYLAAVPFEFTSFNSSKVFKTYASQIGKEI